MSFNKHDISRNACQLFGGQARQGYDWWWHSFTARNEATGEEKPFFAEFFLCNPYLGGGEPILGQLPENKAKGIRPSYLMIKLGSWGEDAVQLHRFFAWEEINVDFGVPFSVSAEECALGETMLKAHVKISEQEAEAHPEWMCGAGEITMDLAIRKIIPFNVGYGAGRLFRKLQLFEMFWHAEGMKTKTREKLNRILAKNTGQPLEKLEHDTDRDNFMGAEEACQYGLIDKVIESR